MNKIIKKSKLVQSNTENLWWKWTTHEGLLTFFGADNNVELKIGGTFEIYFLMDNPKGLQGSEGCQIISYLPNEMLSFTWNAPPDFSEIRNNEHKTWVVVNFNSIEKEKTLVTLHHVGWLEGEKWDEAYDYFNLAWETVLSWLDESCKK